MRLVSTGVSFSGTKHRAAGAHGLVGVGVGTCGHRSHLGTIKLRQGGQRKKGNGEGELTPGLGNTHIIPKAGKAVKEGPPRLLATPGKYKTLWTCSFWHVSHTT